MMGDTASAASGRMSTMRKLKHQFTSLKRAGLEPKEMVSKLAEAFSATQGELTDEVNFFFFGIWSILTSILLWLP